MALQSFVQVVQQPDLLEILNKCLSANTSDIVVGGPLCPTNLHDTCKTLREATQRGLQPLPLLPSRCWQLPVRETQLQRDLAARLAAQDLAGGAPGPGTP